LEIDLADFKEKTVKKSLVFDIHFSTNSIDFWNISWNLWVFRILLYQHLLLASMFASHTLIAYPLISKMGVAKNRAVRTSRLEDNDNRFTLALVSSAGNCGNEQRGSKHLTNFRSGDFSFFLLSFID